MAYHFLVFDVSLRNLIFLCMHFLPWAGYTIPAGWAVMVCPPAVHLNPDIYEDPLAFNPWRWQVCALLICFMQVGINSIYFILDAN